jgi:3D (Asp-Asp-Asp) domain-containing protein
VISFSGKSAIVSAILPGMLFIAPAAASQTATKNVIKTTDVRNDLAPKRTTITRKKKTQRVVEKKPRDLTSFSFSTRSTRQRTQTHGQSVEVLSLGSFTLRAYTHYTRPNKSPNKTATGTVPVSGRTVAVDPRVIPYGTKIYIEGLGERIAEDSGASIKGRRLDVFLPTVEHCHNFGVQTRDVKIMLE